MPKVKRPSPEVLAALRELTAKRGAVRVVTPDVTEVKILRALSMLGDEFVADYREGRMPRDEAMRIADQRERDLASMGRMR